MAGRLPPPHTISAAHSFRRLPLNPSDIGHDTPHVPPAPLSVHPSMDFDTTSFAGYHPSERTRFQTRRTSTLSYQNSGAGDFDRIQSRGPRSLVVVVPPPDLPLQQRQLGNVLAMGPHHRLSQGILMPLFPSMFGQLNAIAREYNFPSIVGLCLYLHINESGITITPRISDDSWQCLFGRFFEAHPPSWGQHLPIGGRIEFDIDPNKARWFDAWVSRTFRDSDPPPPFLTSYPSLATHWQGEGMNADEKPDQGGWNASGSHTLATSSQSETPRHLPKKLSLVDRLESHGLHVPPKLQNHSDHFDPPQAHGTDDLSPPPQLTIPQVVNSDLEQRVSSWRETTGLYPISMTETYRPAPDVAIPAGATTLGEYTLEHDFRQTVKVGESLWSVPSAGPSPSVIKSPIASSQPSLVRPDRLQNESVPPSPITATSWGPIDDELCSAVSAASRLPSPDLGERTVEDVMAPRHSAVWGNSFGWRSEKTWKGVYPYSVSQTKSMIHLQLQGPNSAMPQYPNLVVYSTVDCHPDTHSSYNISVHPKSSTPSPWGSSFGWQREVTWRKVYPYSLATLKSVAPVQPCGAGGLVAKYPIVHIYPAVYPYLDIYPVCAVEKDISRPVSVRSDESDAHPTLIICMGPIVYPHIDIYPPVVEHVNMKLSGLPNTSIHSSNGVSTLYPNLVVYPAVYPHFDLYPVTLQIDQMLAQKEVDARPVGSSCHTVEYPNIIPYPAAYPNFDIDPPSAAIVKGDEFGMTKNDQCIIGLIPCYPNLVIYPAVYPYIDVYPCLATVVTCGNKPANLRCRPIETWRAKTAAAVGLDELLANNHIWDADEPLRIDLADYAWSQTSAGPSTSPIELPLTPSSSGSMHIDQRIQGSVSLTPSTATWIPQDDDQYPDMINTRGSSSLNLDQGVLDDVENIAHPYKPWHLVWPFFEVASQVKGFPPVFGKSAPVPERPQHPYSNLYPTWTNIPTPKNQVTETLTSQSRYPILDVYSVVYPHFDIYPAIDLRVEVFGETILNTRHERVEVKLPALYPDLDIYHACYPCNLDAIYPPRNVVVSTQASVELSHGYPWLVIYPPVYPFITPYPGLTKIREPLKPQKPSSPSSPPGRRESVSLKSPVQYSTLDIDSAGYPWSLECIYPAALVDDCSSGVNPEYPCLRIGSGVYPFVRPYPNVSDPVHIPGELNEDEYGSVKARFAMSEYIAPESVVYPYFNLYPSPPTPSRKQGRAAQALNFCDSTTSLSQMHGIMQSDRKTHTDLHASILRSLEKQLARSSKTHLQLHFEVFQHGIVWTPGEYGQDLAPLSARKREEIEPVDASPRWPPKDGSTPRPPRSTPRIYAVQLPDNFGFPLGESIALPPISPVRLRSPSAPPLPSPAVSETPMPLVQADSQTHAHRRSASSRLSQAAKSMMPKAPRRNSSVPPVSPSPKGREEHVEDSKFPTKFPPSLDRPPHTSNPEFLTHAPQISHKKKESLVLQRARAYEQAISTNQSSSRTAGAKGTHTPPHASTLTPDALDG